MAGDNSERSLTPPTSNTSTVYPDCMQGPSEPCAGYRQLLNHAEAHRREAERLQLEFQRMEGERDRMWRERDDLQERCAELERFNVGLATESERRRAALEAVRAAFDGGRPGLFCRLDMLRDAEPLVRAALSGEPGSGHETSAIPAQETRRQAFEAWWKTIWVDGNDRSSPAFDEQMKKWSHDAWRAGADYERRREAATRSSEKASDESWQCPTCKRGVPRSETACLWCGPIIAQNGEVKP